MIYDLPQEVRDSVIIDESSMHLSSSFDEYLYKHYQYRRPAYQFLRKRLELGERQTLTLKSLHEIVTAKITDDRYASVSKLPGFNKIAYYAENRTYYDTYQLHTDLLLWDSKHLMLEKYRRTADELSQEIAVVEKHWRMLFSPKLLQKTGNFWKLQQAVKDVSATFWRDILQGITADDDLEVIIMYGKMYVVEKSTGLGMGIYLMEDGRFWCQKTCQLGMNGYRISSVTERLVAGHKFLQQLMLKLANSTNEIRLNYFAKINHAVMTENASQYAELMDVLVTVLNEFKQKQTNSYLSTNHLHLVEQFDQNVLVRRITYSTIFSSKLDVYQLVDGVPAKKYSFEQAPIYRSSVQHKAKEFLLEGLLNIYTDRERMKLDSYFEIIGKPDEFVLLFMRKTLAEIKPLALDYFNLFHNEIGEALKEQKDHRVSYALYMQHKTVKTPPLPETVLEVEYAKKYPSKAAAKQAEYATMLHEELRKRRKTRVSS